MGRPGARGGDRAAIMPLVAAHARWTAARTPCTPPVSPTVPRACPCNAPHPRAGAAAAGACVARGRGPCARRCAAEVSSVRHDRAPVQDHTAAAGACHARPPGCPHPPPRADWSLGPTRGSTRGRGAAPENDMALTRKDPADFCDTGPGPGRRPAQKSVTPDAQYRHEDRSRLRSGHAPLDHGRVPHYGEASYSTDRGAIKGEGGWRRYR